MAWWPRHLAIRSRNWVLGMFVSYPRTKRWFAQFLSYAQTQPGWCEKVILHSPKTAKSSYAFCVFISLQIYRSLVWQLTGSPVYFILMLDPPFNINTAPVKVLPNKELARPWIWFILQFRMDKDLVSYNLPQDVAFCDTKRRTRAGYQRIGIFIVASFARSLYVKFCMHSWVINIYFLII